MHRFLNSSRSIIAYPCNGIINKAFPDLEFEPDFKAEARHGCCELTHSKERGWTLFLGLAAGGSPGSDHPGRKVVDMEENWSMKISLQRVVRLHCSRFIKVPNSTYPLKLSLNVASSRELSLVATANPIALVLLPSSQSS